MSVRAGEASRALRALGLGVLLGALLWMLSGRLGSADAGFRRAG